MIVTCSIFRIKDFLGRIARRGGKRVCRRHLVAADDVRVSIHNDGLALLHLSSGKVFLCNETGSLIWQGLVAGVSPEAISDEISHEYGVEAELVRHQTSVFVGELERRGLVVRKARRS